MDTHSPEYKYWFNVLFMGRRFDGQVDVYRSKLRFSKTVIVTGTVGNRSDLLAGWLADNHLEKFDTVNWHIFPVLGKSQIHHAIKWALLQDAGNRMHNSIEQNESNKDLDIIRHILNDFVVKNHDPLAKWSMTKSHYTSKFLAHVIPREHWDKFLVIDLLINDADSVKQVLWERFVKNILWPIKTTIDQTQHENSELANRLINRLLIEQDLKARKEAQGVLDEAEKYYKRSLIPAMTHASVEVLGYPSHNQKTDLENFPAIEVDYRTIMSPGGISSLLGDLGLPTDKSPDWDKIYPLARSPDRVFAGGRVWVNPAVQDP